MTNNIKQFSDALDKIAATSNPPKTSRERKLEDALAYLIVQTEEDCPKEYRTNHLVEALESATALIMEIYTKALLDDRGYDNKEDMLKDYALKSVVPGVCSNRDCLAVIDVEPDATHNHCDCCGGGQVRSCLILWKDPEEDNQ